MVRFSGIINNRSREYLLRKMKKRVIFLFIIMFCLLGIPSIFIAIKFQIYFFLILSFLTAICPFFILSLSYREYFPKNIIIDREEIQIETCANCRICSIEDVKNVLDYGAFFDIIIYSPTRIYNCICQKDLLVEGTIEEFEKLFEDKIVRKYGEEN